MKNILRSVIFAGFRLGGYILQHLFPEMAVVKIFLQETPVQHREVDREKSETWPIMIFDNPPLEDVFVGWQGAQAWFSERRAVEFYCEHSDLVLMSRYIGRVDLPGLDKIMTESEDAALSTTEE